MLSKSLYFSAPPQYSLLILSYPSLPQILNLELIFPHFSLPLYPKVLGCSSASRKFSHCKPQRRRLLSLSLSFSGFSLLSATSLLPLCLCWLLSKMADSRCCFLILGNLLLLCKSCQLLFGRSIRKLILSKNDSISSFEDRSNRFGNEWIHALLILRANFLLDYLILNKNGIKFH